MARISVAVVAFWSLSLPIDSTADDIDKFAAGMDISNAESMAVAGVLGKTVDQLKDPRSLQIADAYTKRSENSLTGCLEFRSRNSFSGYVPGHSAWNLRIVKSKPTLSFYVDNGGQWNKFCTGKGFKDQKGLANTLYSKIREGL